MKEDIPEQEYAIEIVNINLISFKSNHSTVIAKLKTSEQATMMVPHKVDIGCNGNINSTTITQLGRCGVIIENNIKCKNASFL